MQKLEFSLEEQYWTGSSSDWSGVEGMYHHGRGVQRTWRVRLLMNKLCQSLFILMNIDAGGRDCRHNPHLYSSQLQKPDHDTACYQSCLVFHTIASR
jgi:hypothetical protein